MKGKTQGHSRGGKGLTRNSDRPSWSSTFAGQLGQSSRKSRTVAMTRVLVVDDHTVIRRGIQSILRAWPEWEIAGEASDGEEAIQLTTNVRPDIVLMDISMPRMGGLEATRAIRKVCPEVKILLLTLHDSLEWVEIALQAGARGYLLKS